jgi:hypothetical protein
MGRGRNGKRGGSKNPNPGGMITHIPNEIAHAFRELDRDKKRKGKERKSKLEELRRNGGHLLGEPIDTQIHHTKYGFDTRVDYFEGGNESDRAVRVACEMSPREIEYILMMASGGQARFELRQSGSVEEGRGNRVTVVKFDDFYKLDLIRARGDPAKNELTGIKGTVKVLQEVFEEYLGGWIDLG